MAKTYVLPRAATVALHVDGDIRMTTLPALTEFGDLSDAALDQLCPEHFVAVDMENGEPVRDDSGRIVFHDDDHPKEWRHREHRALVADRARKDV